MRDNNCHLETLFDFYESEACLQAFGFNGLKHVVRISIGVKENAFYSPQQTKKGVNAMVKIEFINKEKITREVMIEALHNMTGSELRLFLYLINMVASCTGKWFPLDRREAIYYYGISNASYQRAINSLGQKGYLKKIALNTYCFDATKGFAEISTK